jgi:hypothetical protein
MTLIIPCEENTPPDRAIHARVTRFRHFVLHSRWVLNTDKPT